MAPSPKKQRPRPKAASERAGALAPDYRNPGVLRFRGVLVQEDVRGAGAWIEFPYSVEELFGVKGRVPVVATFDGEPYRGSLVKMGGTCHLLLVLKEIREKLGKKAGDSLQVTVRLDQEPRIVTLSSDVLRALKKNPAAYSKWKDSSYSHQREHHLWIEDAKKPETRERRITQFIKLLASGKK